jgi:hypothetical protein
LSSKTKTESNLTELALAVLLLALLALLTANILVYLIASKHNDEICRAVTIAAAKAAVAGEDKKNAYMAAWQELGLGGYGGFFLDAPKIAAYSDETTNNKRRIKVQTKCFARVPVSNLILADDLKKALTLKRTYLVEIGLAPSTERSDKSIEDEDSNDSKDSPTNVKESSNGAKQSPRGAKKSSSDGKESKDTGNSDSSNNKSN